LSRQLINEYRAELDRMKAISGSKRETNLRPAFGRLLRAWGKQHDLLFSEEYQRRTDKGNLISIDGALAVKIGVLVGYWEAKDEKDDLATEIEDKFPKGCPKNTITFSDNVTAILWQGGPRGLSANKFLFVAFNRSGKAQQSAVIGFQTRKMRLYGKGNFA
jgi:hypothetical protein